MNAKVESGMAKLSLAAVRAMPIAAQVAVRERLQTTGRLDHPRFDIRMEVANQIELFRLGSCAKEPETVEWIEQNLVGGDSFYDIGANVGAYTLIAQRILGADGAVTAFEPGFATYASLVRNVMLNDADGIVLPLNIALGSRRAITRLHYSTLLSGGAMHGFGENAASASQAGATDGNGGRRSGWQDVLTFRLDELVELFELNPPNLIKLDVDGTEAEVLRGAGELLSADRLRSVLVEVDERRTEETAEITGLIEAAGLELRDKRLHQRSGVSNYIFVRP